MLESSIGKEAVALATNAIVNDVNTNMGLYWAPVRRTVSKFGKMRKKAREMCQTAKRRQYLRLIHQWDQNNEEANSMIKARWNRKDMI